MKRRALTACLLGLLSTASPASGQPPDGSDWLVLLPLPDAAVARTKAREEMAPLRLIYPRRGLPAVVQAGAELVVRVRLPSALTPPPGAQQPRALEGFFAEAIARGVAVDGRTHTVRFELPIRQLRPDAAWSLVYRLALQVPGWLPPGSYGLHLSTVAGPLELPGAVRVLERGAPLRLGVLSDEGDRERARGLPIDVWIAPRPAADPLVRASPDGDAVADADLNTAPVLYDRGPAAAFRIGSDRLLVRGEFEPSWSARLAALLEHEARVALPPPRPVLEPGRFSPLGGTARELPAPGTLRRTATEGGLTVQLSTRYPEPAETAVFVPGAAGATISGCRARHFIGYELVRPGAKPAVLALLELTPGSRCRIRPGAPAGGRDEDRAIATRPSIPQTGQPVELSVRGARDDQRVAWSLGREHSAFGPGVLTRRLERPGMHVAHAVTIDGDGRLSAATREVGVLPARPAGCSTAAPAARAQGPRRWLEALTAALLLLSSIRRVW